MSSERLEGRDNYALLVCTIIILFSITQTALALDADNDGCPTWLDGDFNQDGKVNFSDLARFRTTFGTDDPITDLDENGSVGFSDLARFRALFGKPLPRAAKLSWTAPETNSDNTPLTDLAGYKVYPNLANPIATVDTGLLIGCLDPGQWSFKVTALDETGNESVFSNVGTKEIL